MKVLVSPTNYTFDATAKTITFSTQVPASLASILHVTNVTRGVMYFQPQAGLAYSGSYSSPVLTLNASTTGHSNTDVLEVFYDDGIAAATAANQTAANTALVSIDGKTPALVSGKVPVQLAGLNLTTPLSVQNVNHDDLVFLLNRVLQYLNSPQGYDKSQQRQRGTVIIESGTVSSVVSSGTITNLSTIDTLQGRIQVYGANLSAWSDTVRSRIT